jgi:hypothetical protein
VFRIHFQCGLDVGFTRRSFRDTYLRQTEIENLGMAAIRNENVGRLDVPVDDPLGVGSIEGVGHFDRHILQNLLFHGPIRNGVLQGLAFQILHGDEGLARLLAYVVNSADVRMVQCRRGARFPFESFQRLWVARNVVRKELQRDEAAQSYVFGLVNNTHTAATELFDDAVVRDGLPEE